MSHRPDDEETRELALAHWQTFCSRILPRIVRRIAAWKQLTRPAQTDLLEDLQQELAVDCLANAPHVVVEPPRVRHGRWLRTAERFAYDNFVQPHRRRVGTDELTARPEPSLVPPPDTLLPLATLHNGRANVKATAALVGIGERRARQLLEELATRLGADDEYRAFWRARLAEALTGLAADLLRDRDRVQLLPRPRRSPDPAGRLLRLRRLVGRFPIRPSTQRERRALQGLLRRGRRFDASTPRRLLESATTLAPFDHAAWLWLFEARLAEGDVRGAAAALRRCRQVAAPTVAASTLARARLLEVRGLPQRAVGVVVRGARRCRHDHRLGAVAAQLVATPTPAATDAAATTTHDVA